MRTTKLSVILLILLFILSCGSEKKDSSKKETTKSTTETSKSEQKKEVKKKKKPSKYLGKLVADEIMAPYDTMIFKEYYGTRHLPPEFNFNIDVSELTLEEIRLIRNEIFARKGYLFNNAVLRGYFNGEKWYQPPWWEEDYTIELNKEEQNFVSKCLAKEKELAKENYVEVNGHNIPNADNVINYHQFHSVGDKLLEKLKANGFAIVPNDNIQLFHVYEKNDYRHIPSFVTTDLFLQLYHMYFSYVLRELEEKEFIPLLESTLESLFNETFKKKYYTNCVGCEEPGFHAQSYYSVALQLLTGKEYAVISSRDIVSSEVKKALEASGQGSEFMNDKEYQYNIFKARGHYTRSEQLTRYFKSMIWLQTANYCLDNDEGLNQAIANAYFLVKTPKALENYKKIYEVTSFIVGESDNISLIDLAEIIKKDYNSDRIATVLDCKKEIRKELENAIKSSNRIFPRYETGCHNKINFMPQRYLFDNDILNKMNDGGINIPAKRLIPKGLDVFAALGVSKAEDILLNEYKENENWDGYTKALEDVKSKFKSFNNWDKTVYNKWMQSLIELNKPNKDYPLVMQTPAWQKKNLNTSLASWTELKHDVILYAERPMAAECGGWGPDEPDPIGYVEPNIKFWNKAVELTEKTIDVLKKSNFYTDEISNKSERILELAKFLHEISIKEIEGKEITKKEYGTIQVIGSNVEYITLSLLEGNTDHWSLVKGPDKKVAVIADVFAGNDQVLEEAVGYVNDIYVIVEINGSLYLTKGAVFSYYEFLHDINDPLTDEEWHEMLDKKNNPDMPKWMKEIIAPVAPLEVKSNYIYSSGC